MVVESTDVKRNFTLNTMLKKLEELYKKEEELQTQLDSIQMDKEMLENMIMYYYAKTWKG